MKKFFITLVIFVVTGVVLVFLYNQQIFQYSAEKIILAMLPDYLKIDAIKFDLAKKEVEARGIRISNSPGFSDPSVLEIESVRCAYRLNSANILDGLTITYLSATRPVLKIERLRDGKINLEEMKSLSIAAREKPSKGNLKELPKSAAGAISSKKPSELLRLPDALEIVAGNVVFTDRAVFKEPHTLTFDNINAKVSLKLNDDYSQVLYLTSSGAGIVNKQPAETVEWVISLTPTTPRLTMSNHFNVSKVDILPFQPYFYKYSPFIIKSGKFSGELVFDFDNGNIGSMNTVWLDGLTFAVKQGYENARLWEVAVPDLVKYFSTASGAIVFDFKIKGEMSNPQFHLGPRTKQALAVMAVDKISEAVARATQKDGGGSDMDKAQAVIGIVKELMKK